jgi:hypothetical protein
MQNMHYYVKTVESILMYDSKTGRLPENRVRPTVRKFKVRSPTSLSPFDDKIYGLFEFPIIIDKFCRR